MWKRQLLYCRISPRAISEETLTYSAIEKKNYEMKRDLGMSLNEKVADA